MTKQEVRWLVLAMLQIRPGMTLLDMGCGSGSVTVEMARMAGSGRVYALEQKPEAVELTKKNLNQFGLSNVTILPGRGENLLEELPELDRVFIGGAGGALEEIVQYVARKMKPKGRMVITAVTLETVSLARQLLKQEPFKDVTIQQTSVTRYLQRGGYTMAQAENPVTIFSAEVASVGK